MAQDGNTWRNVANVVLNFQKIPLIAWHILDQLSNCQRFEKYSAVWN